MKYAFIKEHRLEFRIRSMCRVLKVHPSGYYAWLKQPKSKRTIENERLSSLISQLWLESGCVYGYRKIHDDLLSEGENCSLNHVAKLMRNLSIKAQIGYKRRQSSYGGKPAIVAPNILQRDFNSSAPNQSWVTDITYIRTHEGWLYLAVVIDLYSRKVVGWSMQSRMEQEIVLNALLMAIWRRKPAGNTIVHSDQGTQYTSQQWRSFLQEHQLRASMSRRANCWDNAVAESFFQLLKRERIKRRIYRTREEAKQDIFDYIEFFYNSKRKHSNNGMLSPTQFEELQELQIQSV